MNNNITTAEIVIGTVFLLGIDVVALLLDFIPIMGWLMASAIQSAASFGTSWWLRSKGEKRAFGLERQLMKQAANFLPWIPTCFSVFLIEVGLHIAKQYNPGAVKVAKNNNEQ